MGNETNIAVLQEQMKNVMDRLEEHCEQDKVDHEQTKNAIQETKEALDGLTAEIQVFTTSIKAGKWVIITVLLGLGAIGHKSIAWIMQFFTN